MLDIYYSKNEDGKRV
jgi:serine/threonine protein kinase